MPLQFPVQALKCLSYRCVYMLHQPFLYCLLLAFQFLLACLNVYSVLAVPACSVTECEAEKIKCFCFAVLAVLSGKSPELYDSRLVHCKFQSEFCHPLRQFLVHFLCLPSFRPCLCSRYRYKYSGISIKDLQKVKVILFFLHFPQFFLPFPMLSLLDVHLLYLCLYIHHSIHLLLLLLILHRQCLRWNI
jgi:hypothetical protein